MFLRDMELITDKTINLQLFLRKSGCFTDKLYSLLMSSEGLVFSIKVKPNHFLPRSFMEAPMGYTSLSIIMNLSWAVFAAVRAGMAIKFV